jgi:hypothetical protein
MEGTFDQAVSKVTDTGYILSLCAKNNLCRCCCRPYPGQKNDHEVCHLLKDAWNQLNTHSSLGTTARLLEEAAEILKRDA